METTSLSLLSFSRFMDIADGLLFSGSPAAPALHPFSSALSGGSSFSGFSSLTGGPSLPAVPAVRGRPFSSPGPYEAPSVIADQIFSPGLYESLPDQLVIFRVPVLDQRPLHGLLVGIHWNVHLLHGPGIQACVIHTGGDGGRRGVEILDLLRHIAQIPEVLCQLHRFL